MKTEIITIGDEILSGHIQNLNAQWLANHLTENGFDVRRITTLPDNTQTVIDCFQMATERSELVFVTGGLGPTNDDITHQAISEFFKVRWKFNERVYERLKEFLLERGYTMSHHSKQNAKVPENAQIFINHEGTAPGLMLQTNNVPFIFVPGVHVEMKKMAEESIIPQLKKVYLKNSLINEVIVVQGITEAHLAKKLKYWEKNLPSEFSLAYLPGPALVKLRITGRGSNHQILRDIAEAKIAELYDIIPEHYVARGNVTLEEVVGNMLAVKGETLSTAESCTGGAISAAIVSVPGSSDYYKGSVVAYSNQIKHSVLSVSEDIIKRYGAVSREVTEAMAKNVRELFKTDYAIAVSGIAGPSGGTYEKPVGTTWITVVRDSHIESKMFLFGKNRATNIQKTKNTSLNMLRKIM
ncbi:MAG: CinA family nicotinamide mononucleotide deamidase-related protein [Bacteroidales bacterium]